MKNFITLDFILISFILSAQVSIGIGTDNPKGILDINTNNTGLILPRVSAIENITDGNGNPPVNDTTVYDISRNTTCFYQDSSGLPVITNQTI